ncbi:glutamate--tRNA ligase [Candidatus Woesearchaeota archaeon]|jgi:glutamyl-tRNA synthetase|nr:glutamate--tRNA ligase [Candidatus Woesearchaeota archaeon]MBT5272905.1 glutamate--tRNA ligase [Candidatus Woesearchaeota archaeon]MBT6041371.1 glutamate--tRNA ligase [Candidatus Woesearchaeota archaeon]MBT6337254.1 glutamate--tRNA ligase [Candidatus Woesearchaeota archaeon]MBT7927131.1 glutamate--tRNA ligase [Candidatus Woesearchaeota archaeon]
MKDKILKLALENAVKYNGKASVGSVIGKLVSTDPKIKAKMNEISKDIGKIVKEVNAMPVEKQLEEFEKLGGKIVKEKKEKIIKLPKLKKLHKPVVMRFEPSPSGPMHIGHAYVLGLNHHYAKEHNGKLILRIGDTNASNIYEPSYELIPKDAEWLTKGKVEEFMIQSDRLDFYYDYALKFIDAGHCYVCTCPAEEFREISKGKEECPCRNLTVDENAKRWRHMFDKYKEGDAVLRFKTDMKHKNPAMRDFPLFRINDDPHPRTEKKFRVWPLMNFSVLVDDHDSGMTHIIRAKDHADNAKRQEMMYKAMNWDVPETLFVGRINFQDLEVSCSKTREKIDAGKFTGWDDIRLPFLIALKRRGYQPEAFIKYALDVGISLNDKTVSKKDFFKTINYFNKEILEEKSNRHFFIANPVKITIKDAPSQEIELDLHPDHRKGGRNFDCGENYFLAKEDVDNFKKGKLYRLMDCVNFEFIKKDEYKYHSTLFKEVKGNAGLIHWLPQHDTVDVEVVMDDGSIVKGVGERLLNDLKEGDTVQFVRFGFCRLDSIEADKLVFWFGHK